MKNCIKDNCKHKLDNVIRMVVEGESYSISKRDITVLATEKKYFARRLDEKLYNFIISFDIESNVKVIRIYSTVEKHRDEYIDLQISEEQFDTIDYIVNTIKQYTWTFEDSGGIKTKKSRDEEYIALRYLPIKYKGEELYIGENDDIYLSDKCKTTKAEVEMLEDIEKDER